MIEKILILCLITVLVFFIYDFVRNIWSVDMCLSYYQMYGDYNFTSPLTNKKTSTMECYHEALNYIGMYIIVIVFLSGLIGLLLGYFDGFKIVLERKKEF